MPPACWGCRLVDLRRMADPLIVAPTPTPFDGNDRVDQDALARNIEPVGTTPRYPASFSVRPTARSFR